MPPGDSDFELRVLRGGLEIIRNGEHLDPPSERLHTAALIALLLRPQQRGNPTHIANVSYDDPPFNFEKRISETLSILRNKPYDLPIARRTYELTIPPSAIDYLAFTSEAARHLELLARSPGAADGPLSAKAVVDEIAETLGMWQQDPDVTFAGVVKQRGLFAAGQRLHKELVSAFVTALLANGELQQAQRALVVHGASYLNDPQFLALADQLDRTSLDQTRGRAGTSPSATVRHNLPSAADITLLGRSDTLQRAHAVLRPYPHSQYPLITIDGVGGVGKTALALSIAHEYVELANPDADEQASLPSKRERFDAIVWASAKRETLGDSGIQTQQQVLRNLRDIYIATALTLGREEVLALNEADQDALIRMLLSSQRVLLVLDNLETVDDPRVLEFLRGLPAPTKAIITTRHRIDGAVSVRLEGLDEQDAMRLADLAATARNITIDHPEQQQLAQASSGIPLAIIWSVAQVAAGRDLKTTILRLRSAKGDYARFCFDESLAWLSRDHRGQYALRTLLSLSLFPDGASRDAIGWVAGLDAMPEERDQALNILGDLSLSTLRDDRHHLLSLTREYALAELARDLLLKDSATDRLLSWYLQLTARGAGGGADLDASIPRLLERDHGNIIGTIQIAYDMERMGLYIRLLRNMEFFWLESGRWYEFERYLGTARLIAPEPHDRIHFTVRLVWLSVLRHDLATGEELVAEARRLLAVFPNDYETMRLDDFEGQLALEGEEYDRAEDLLKSSLAQAATLGDRRGQFACNKYLGELCCATERPLDAKLYLGKADQFVGQPGEDQWLRGRAHSSQLRGRIAEAEHSWDDATLAYRESLKYLEFHGDVRLRTKVRSGLARALAAQKQREEALALTSENLKVFQALGMWRDAAQATEILSMLEGTDNAS